MASATTAVIKISKLVTNSGQIDGLPKNPRVIRDENFKRLKDNVQKYGEMLSYRDLIVYPYGDKFVVICGNQRLAAMRELGYKECPVTILPEETSAEKLRAFAIKDNVDYGKWDMDRLANEWDYFDLEQFGIDLSCWVVKEQDISNTGEIDVDTFAETMELKLTMPASAAEFVKEKLKEYSPDPAIALITIIDGGYGKEGDA